MEQLVVFIVLIATSLVFCEGKLQMYGFMWRIIYVLITGKDFFLVLKRYPLWSLFFFQNDFHNENKVIFFKPASKQGNLFL